MTLLSSFVFVLRLVLPKNRKNTRKTKRSMRIFPHFRLRFLGTMVIISPAARKSHAPRHYIRKDKNFFIFLKLPIDKPIFICYNSQANKQRLVGQAVKTLASHAENMGSIPVRVTIKRQTLHKGCLFFYCAPHKTEPTCANTNLYFLLLLLRKGFAYRHRRYLALFGVSAAE